MQAYNIHGGQGSMPQQPLRGIPPVNQYQGNGKGAAGVPMGVSSSAQGATAGPGMMPAETYTNNPWAVPGMMGAGNMGPSTPGGVSNSPGGGQAGGGYNPNRPSQPAPNPPTPGQGNGGGGGYGGGGQGPFVPLAYGTPEMGAAFYRHAATSPGSVGSAYWLDRASRAYENPLPGSPNAVNTIYTDAYGNRRFDYQPGGAAFGEATGRYNPGDYTHPGGLSTTPVAPQQPNVTHWSSQGPQPGGTNPQWQGGNHPNGQMFGNPAYLPPIIPTAPASIRNNLPDTGNASRMPGVRTAPSGLRATGRGIITR